MAIVDLLPSAEVLLGLDVEDLAAVLLEDMSLRRSKTIQCLGLTKTW